MWAIFTAERLTPLSSVVLALLSSYGYPTVESGSILLEKRIVQKACHTSLWNPSSQIKKPRVNHPVLSCSYSEEVLLLN